MAAPISTAHLADQSLPRHGVTGRETEVLFLVVDRYRNAEIAAKLAISKRTVESHIAALLRKLGAANRTELMHIGSRYSNRRAPSSAERTVRSGELTAVRDACGAMRRIAVQLRQQSARRCANSAELLDRSRVLVADTRTITGQASRARANVPIRQSLAAGDGPPA